ncbi:MAG: HDOD domain-containing protein [Desulfobacteraceae bacterium]|nr:MAG: HDOD domain-containing protein [Desulfobacteraceae bacterium]
MEIYVARQPVFNLNKEIYGYELLFRNGLQNAFPDIDGTSATASLLANTFFSFGIDEITGSKPGLINFTTDLILQKTPLLFPREDFIIEVLEDVEPTPAVVEAVKEMKAKGYTIALDDFVFDQKQLPMIQQAALIKFDIMATPLDTLQDLVPEIQKAYGLTLLAEKVETYEEFEQAKAMGFTLFQGYFFSKPEVLSNKDITTNQVTKLKIITLVSQEDPDLSALETLIKNDVSISYKLLKFINSAYFARANKMSTIKDAMTFLGTEELKKFIKIVTISELDEEKPHELIRLSMIRARICELSGSVLNTRFSSEELFTLGLFSLMDAIMDKPMDQIVNTVAFSSKITRALSGKDPEFKKILGIISLFEKGQWDHKVFKAMSGSRLMKNLPEFYMDAVKMANAFYT